MDKFDRIYALHGFLSGRKQPAPLPSIMDALECSQATAKRIISNMRLYLDAPIAYDRAAGGITTHTTAPTRTNCPACGSTHPNCTRC